MSISVIFFTPLSVDTTLELLSYTSIRHIHLGFAKWYKSIGAVARERLVKEYRDPLGQRFAGYVKFFTFEMKGAYKEHCAAVGNFKQQYSPFSNTYNPATRNHPNFCWSNEPQPQLGLGELKPTAMKLQLVDHSIQMPRGVIEDVSVQVDKFYYPVDFVVLDTQPVLHSENEIPVILGRPFLATCDTHISCRSGVDKWRPRFEKLPPRKEKTLPSNVEVPKLELKPYLRDLNMHSWGPTTLFYW
ncbi:unnamed protein product [Prunus armeniaca]